MYPTLEELKTREEFLRLQKNTLLQQEQILLRKIETIDTELDAVINLMKLHTGGGV